MLTHTNSSNEEDKNNDSNTQTNTTKLSYLEVLKQKKPNKELNKESDAKQNTSSYLQAALRGSEIKSDIQASNKNKYISPITPSYNKRETLPSRFYWICKDAYRKLNSGLVKEALDILTELDIKIPNQCSILNALGRCYDELKKHKQAKNVFLRALQIAIDNDYTSDIQSITYSIAIHYKKSLDFVNYKNMLTRLPDQNSYLALMGWLDFYMDYAYYTDKPKEYLKEALKIILKFNSIKTTEKQKLLIDLRYHEITLYNHKKVELEEIMRFLKQIIEGNAKVRISCIITYLTTLQSSMSSKMYNETEKNVLLHEIDRIISSLIQKQPTLYGLHNVKASVLRHLKPLEADKKYDEIHTLFPYEWSAYLAHAYLLNIVMDDPKNTINFIRATIKKESNSPCQFTGERRNQWLAAMYYWLAFAHLESGEDKLAIHSINQSRSYDPVFNYSKQYSYYSLLGKCEPNPTKRSILHNLARSFNSEHYSTNHPKPRENETKMSMEENSEEKFSVFQDVSSVVNNVNENSLINNDIDAGSGWGRWGDSDDEDEAQAEEKKFQESVTIGLQPPITPNKTEITYVNKFINIQFFKYQQYRQNMDHQNNDQTIKLINIHSLK